MEKIKSKHYYAWILFGIVALFLLEIALVDLLFFDLLEKHVASYAALKNDSNFKIDLFVLFGLQTISSALACGLSIFLYRKICNNIRDETMRISVFTE